MTTQEIDIMKEKRRKEGFDRATVDGASRICEFFKQNVSDEYERFQRICPWIAYPEECTAEIHRSLSVGRYKPDFQDNDDFAYAGTVIDGDLVIADMSTLTALLKANNFECTMEIGDNNSATIRVSIPFNEIQKLNGNSKKAS